MRGAYRHRSAGGLWTVDLAADGAQALTKLEEATFDLVVLDIMPRASTFCTLMRMRVAGDDAHVLVLTARDEVDDRVNALDRGADDYLTKPFAIELRSSPRA